MDDENHYNQVLTNVFVELWWFQQHRYLFICTYRTLWDHDWHTHDTEGKQTSVLLPGKKKYKLLKSWAQIQGSLYGKLLHINIHEKH